MLSAEFAQGVAKVAFNALKCHTHTTAADNILKYFFFYFIFQWK